MTLSHTLRANAIFTGICAIACLGWAQAIAQHSALPSDIWVLALGAMLTGYVPILLFAAARPLTWLVKAIIAADWAYVAIASVVLFTRLGQADAAGVAMMAISSGLVALFAILQMRSLATVPTGARL